jgi:hypothetical protein
VLDEAGVGDPTAAQERLTLIEDLPLFDIQRPDVQTLADELVANHLLPQMQPPTRDISLYRRFLV